MYPSLFTGVSFIVRILLWAGAMLLVVSALTKGTRKKKKQKAGTDRANAVHERHIRSGLRRTPDIEKSYDDCLYKHDQSYSEHPSDDCLYNHNDIIGKRGHVVTASGSSVGEVDVSGKRYVARSMSGDALTAGQRVNVVSIRDETLIVSSEDL